MSAEEGPQSRQWYQDCEEMRGRSGCCRLGEVTLTTAPQGHGVVERLPVPGPAVLLGPREGCCDALDDG